MFPGEREGFKRVLKRVGFLYGGREGEGGEEKNHRNSIKKGLSLTHTSERWRAKRESRGRKPPKKFHLKREKDCGKD